MDPQNIWITFPELLTWFPLIAGLVAFIIREEKKVKAWALIASLVTLGISVVSLLYSDHIKYFYLNNVSYFWLKYLGSNLTLGLDALLRVAPEALAACAFFFAPVRWAASAEAGRLSEIVATMARSPVVTYRGVCGK